MTDIDVLFSRAAAGVDTAVSDALIEADLARGRRALKRRKIRRRTAGAGWVAVLAVTAIMLVTPHNEDRSPLHIAQIASAPPVSSAPSSTSGSATGPAPTSGGSGGSGASGASGVSPMADGAAVLVAYTGRQLPGFIVTSLPAGWHLGGSTSVALTIVAATESNTDPDSFVGKLTVMKLSSDAAPHTSGTPVSVGGRRGYFYLDPAGTGTGMLDFIDNRGSWTLTQVPPALHWSAAQTAAFCAQIQVTSNSVTAHG